MDLRAQTDSIFMRNNKFYTVEYIWNFLQTCDNGSRDVIKHLLRESQTVFPGCTIGK